MKITNRIIDTMSNAAEVLKSIIKKEFTAKTSYWMAAALKELEAKSEIYASEKKKIIDKYAVKDEKNEIIEKDGRVSITDVKKFNESLKDLLDIEFDLSMEKIKYDLEKEPKCSIEEMCLLLPLIEVV